MKSTAISSSLILLLFLIGIVMVRCGGLQAAPPNSRWLNIMPDSSFGHWTRVTIPPTRPMPQYSQWSVDKATHTLVCAGDGGHEWLRYDSELGNFILHVEWRLTRHKGAGGYNSGVFVRNNDTGIIWYQAQVGSESGGYWFGYDNPAEKGPIGFNLQKQMASNPVKPAGDWNTFDIRCEGAKLILKVNGTQTSEFAKCKSFKGYLGLEAEGSRIEFRNIRIKLLK